MSLLECRENSLDANFGDFEIFHTRKTADRDRANTLVSIKNGGPTVPPEITDVAVIINVPTPSDCGAPQIAAGLTEAR